MAPMVSSYLTMSGIAMKGNNGVLISHTALHYLEYQETTSIVDSYLTLSRTDEIYSH